MTTLPTDAERAQARAEHLAAIAEPLELILDEREFLVGGLHAALDRLAYPTYADLDEARAIRDRLAELIEDAERGDELTPDESSRRDDIEAGFDLRDLDTEAPR